MKNSTYVHGRIDKGCRNCLDIYGHIGQHNELTETTIGKILKTLQESDSVADVNLLRACGGRLTDNIDLVWENVAVSPNTSIPYRAQKLEDEQITNFATKSSSE